MKNKVIACWIIETIIDCILLSTLLWVDNSINIGSLSLDMATILASIGGIMLIVNFFAYPKVLKRFQA